MPKSSKRPSLTGISEIRTFFRTNQQPIYFVGPTAFNLLGIDRWVRNFQYVVYYDSWDGQHPRVFAPANQRSLVHRKVPSRVDSHGPVDHPKIYPSLALGHDRQSRAVGR